MNKIDKRINTIIEFDNTNHHEFLITMSKALIRISDEINIFCYFETFEKVKSELDMKNLNFYVLNEKNNFLNQIKKIKGFINHYHCATHKVWINTLQLSLFDELIFRTFFHIENQTILTVHNINSWFNINYREIFHNSKNTIFFLNNLFHSINRRAILKKMTGLNFLEINSLNSIKISKIIANKLIYNIPFSHFDSNYYHKHLKSNINVRKVIVIPGMVTKLRKNYDLILDVMNEFKFQNIELVLLGRASDKTGQFIIQKCDDLIKRGINITYFNEYVEPNVYNSIISRSQFIYGDPIKEYYRLGIKEYYTLSKSTGISFSLIKNAKIGILPNWYFIDPQLESSIIRFDSFISLSNVLKFINCAEEEKINELLTLAYNNSKKFSIDRIDLNPKKYSEMINEINYK